MGPLNLLGLKMNTKNLSSCLESTCLKPDVTEDDIKKLCADAKTYEFHSVVVYPVYADECVYVNKVKAYSNVNVCAVVGFPFGKQLPVVKYEEARSIVHRVDELDFVINYSLLKDNRIALLSLEVKILANLCKDKNVISKAIIETCYLSDDEIKRASEIAANAGVDFIKTSTGFGSRGATVKDIELIKSVVGDSVGIKASGGIKSYSDVEKFLMCGATRIGTSNAVAIMEEYKSLNKDVSI